MADERLTRPANDDSLRDDPVQAQVFSCTRGGADVSASLVAIVVGLVLCAVACSRGDRGQGAPSASASPRAPLELPPLPSGDRRAKADCEAPRACLRGVMPEVFDVSQAPALEQKALGCLGGSIERAWDLRECLPFAFARDVRSGQLVQLSMNCGDLCPNYASLVFDLAQAVSEFECVCRGFYPLRTPGRGGYAGCAPPPPNAGKRYFGIVDAFAGQRVVVQGNPRFLELGFLEGAVVDSIDGVAPSGEEELSRGLDGIPQRLPGEIRLHRQAPAIVKELHYITREAAEGLAKLSTQLDLPDLAKTRTGCLDPERNGASVRSFVRVSFGGAKLASGVPAQVFRKPDCVDDGSRRVVQFEEALRAAAKEAKPRIVTSAGSPDACKGVESFHAFSIARGTEELELRYADWATQ